METKFNKNAMKYFAVFLNLINFVISSSIFPGFTLTELLCNQDQDRIFDSRGIEAGVIFDLHPGLTRSSCIRDFTAPEFHGFYIRLYRHWDLSNSYKRRIDKSRNTNYTCPITIYSPSDLLLPVWSIDPCQLEREGLTEDLERIWPGNLRIVWEHNRHTPLYRLSISVLGRGAVCSSKDKHACLKIGEESLLCVSNDLVCDGIKHCPDFSDENKKMCDERNKDNYLREIRHSFNLWEFMSMEVLKNLFSEENKDNDEIATTTISPKELDKHFVDPYEISHTTVKKSSISKGLSRYGPWGYLMLGMLLCGFALLLCGLWECCCRRQKPNSPRSASDSGGNVSEFNGAISPPQLVNASAPQPPNYDELDPPPSYSALFPTIKDDTIPNTIIISHSNTINIPNSSS